MEWYRKISVRGHWRYDSIVAQYAAGVDNAIRWSKLEVNKALSDDTVLSALRGGYYDPGAEAISTDLSVLTALKIERSLSCVSELRKADQESLTAWIEETYRTDLTRGTPPLIVFRAFVLEDGNVEWGYVYPEEGHFSSREDDRKRTDRFLNETVRVDLLNIAHGRKEGRKEREIRH